MSPKCAYCTGPAPEGKTLDRVPWCGCNPFIPEREPARIVPCVVPSRPSRSQLRGSKG